jgi:hypothetical protein
MNKNILISNPRPLYFTYFNTNEIRVQRQAEKKLSTQQEGQTKPNREAFYRTSSQEFLPVTRQTKTSLQAAFWNDPECA